MATVTTADWLRFLHSFALSDHMGDAGNAVQGFADLVGLPMPPDDLDVDDGWLEWIASQGVDEGVSAALLRRKRGE